MSAHQRYQLANPQIYYYGAAGANSPRWNGSAQPSKLDWRQDLSRLPRQPLPTPRFKVTSEDRELVRKGSSPKLEHLRMRPTQAPANQNQFQRQYPICSPTARPSQKSLSKQQITASIYQEKEKVRKAKNQQYNLIHDQYCTNFQDIQSNIKPHRPTQNTQVFSSKQREQKDKNTFEITFSAESTEPEEEKQPARKPQNLYVSKFSSTNTEQKKKEKGEFINGFRKKLIQKQISQKEQIYRGLIRSSSRQSNSSARNQMKSKMKQVLDEIYTLKKVLS